jgi:hypothetical protein
MSSFVVIEQELEEKFEVIHYPTMVSSKVRISLMASRLCGILLLARPSQMGPVSNRNLAGRSYAAQV